MIVQIAVAIFAGLLGWAYVASKPSPPKVCGSPGGPPITSPRVRLSDGRHLAYKEAGVSKKDAKYKIIVIHGFDSSKDLNLPVSQVLIYLLKFQCNYLILQLKLWLDFSHLQLKKNWSQKVPHFIAN